MPHDDSRTGEDTSGERVVEPIIDNFEIKNAEREHVKELLAWVKKCESQKWPDDKKIADICEDNRKYVQGRQHDDGGKGLVRANLIQASIRKTTNRTYARDPEISIVPTEAVTAEEYKKFRAFGKTSEIVVNNYLRRAKIKRKAKANLRAAKTCRIGWVKVGLQKNIKKDAHIVSRINDLQDNILTLKGLKREITDPDFNQFDHDAIEAKILERQQVIEGLQGNVEVIRAEGITIDRIRTENMIIDVTQVEELEEYATAERIGQRFFLSPKVAIERFEDKAKALSIFSVKNRDLNAEEGQAETQDAEKQSKQVKCYEIWDRKTLKYYTVGIGFPGYLKEPVTPDEEVGEQWYPYFPLGLNKVDGKFWPISDVELMKELQDEISTSMTQFKEHRQKSVPFNLFNKSTMDPEEVKKITNPKFYEFIGVTGLADKPLEQLFHEVKPNAIDPSVYGTEHLERKMEQVIAASEPTQPKSNRSKTLGEAKILTQDVATDSTSDQDDLEEWYGDIATYVWQILLKVLTPEQVKEIAGEDAQWPEARQSLNRIYNQLRLEVKPGSSGKPDKAREVETLTTLMPPLTEMILQLAEFRKNGESDLAETQKKIIQEFMRRADEKFDVEEFFPAVADPEAEKEKIEAQKEEQRQAELQTIQMDQKVKESEINKNNAEAERSLAQAEAALNPQPQQQDNTELEVLKLQEKSSLEMQKAELDAATKIRIARDKLEADRIVQAEKNQALIQIAEIERDTEMRKAEVQERIGDKRLLAESNNKDKDIAATVETKEKELSNKKETEEMKAKSSEKVSKQKESSKADQETKAEKSKQDDKQKQQEPDILSKITQTLEALSSKLEELGGEKEIIFDKNNKPVGIKPANPKK